MSRDINCGVRSDCEQHHCDNGRVVGDTPVHLLSNQIVGCQIPGPNDRATGSDLQLEVRSPVADRFDRSLKETPKRSLVVLARTAHV